MFVHAHGVAAPHLPTAMVMSEADATLNEHCAEHDAMPVDATAHTDMVMQDAGTQHEDPYPDCCNSLLCQCPCMQAFALSITLPHVMTGSAAASTAVTADSALLHAGVSGQFRPPI